MKISQNCEHLDDNNRPHCNNEVEKRCMCCGSWACGEHSVGNCRFGGEPFVEVE